MSRIERRIEDIFGIYRGFTAWDLEAAAHLYKKHWGGYAQDYPNLTAEQLVSLMLDGVEVSDVNPQTWGRA